MYRNLLGGGVLALAFAACGGGQDADVAIEEPAAGEPQQVEETVDAPQARATFINSQGTQIGTADLTQVGETVEIEVDLAFLQAGERGFHIHEVGSCEAPSFESAGDHFNPTNASHGLEHPQGPHAGDLENLEVETDDGTARGVRRSTLVTLVPGQPNSILDADGSALVVHAQADDYETQPAGDSGDPIACGVIEQV